MKEEIKKYKTTSIILMIVGIILLVIGLGIGLNRQYTANVLIKEGAISSVEGFLTYIKPVEITMYVLVLVGIGSMGYGAGMLHILSKLKKK